MEHDKHNNVTVSKQTSHVMIDGKDRGDHDLRKKGGGVVFDLRGHDDIDGLNGLDLCLPIEDHVTR